MLKIKGSFINYRDWNFNKSSNMLKNWTKNDISFLLFKNIFPWTYFSMFWCLIYTHTETILSSEASFTFIHDLKVWSVIYLLHFNLKIVSSANSFTSKYHTSLSWHFQLKQKNSNHFCWCLLEHKHECLHFEMTK